MAKRTLEETKELIRHITHEAEYMQRNHAHVELVEPDHVRLSAEVQPDVCNNYNIAHGGFFYTMCDSAAGQACLTDGRFYVTQSSNMEFISFARGDGHKIYADGTIIHRGQNMTVARAQITDGVTGKLLVEGTFNFFCVDMEMD